MQFTILLEALIFLCGFCQATACSPTMFAVGNTIYTLSDTIVDANTASNECKLLGGQLAVVKDQAVKDKFYQEILRKYNNTDLQRVYILYDYLPDKSTPPQSRIVYKFSKDSAITGNWKSAKELHQIWYLDLYKTYNAQRIAVYFCQYHSERWRVVTQGEKSQSGIINNGCPTSESWSNDFGLFAWKSQAADSQTIYNFFRNFHPHSSRLTDVNRFFDGFNTSKGNFNVPVRSVFVGARYNTNSKQWLWSDGQNANFANNPFKCKQKAFSYGMKDLEDRNCSGQLAYYSCEIRPTLSTRIILKDCNSTVINVTWSNDISTLAKKTGSIYQLKVSVSQNGQSILVKTFNQTVSSLTVGGLKKRTVYEIQFNASLTGCGSFSFTSSNKVTTGYGKPDPVNDAYVKSPQSCVVAFNNSLTDKNITSYAITAASGKVVDVHKEFSLADSYMIDVSNHSTGKNISLTIQAFSCEGGSQQTQVAGFCFKPLPLKSTDTSTGRIVGGLVGALLSLLLLIVLGIVLRKRLQEGKKENNDNIIEVNGNSSQTEAGSNNLQAMNTKSKIAINQEEKVYVNVRNVTSTSKGVLGGNQVLYENLNVLKNPKTLKSIFENKSAANGSIFRKEFQEIVRIDKSTPKSCKHAASDHNAPRNRYKNIITYDHSRVILSGKDKDDYINASYMPGYSNEKKFIATQGPKPNTFGDFWLMVWQQQASVIVMLTKLKENGKVKCDQYWPDLGKEEAYGMVLVSLKQETDVGGIILRTFDLKMEQSCLSVVHFQYTTWPDHGIPVTTTKMVYLRKMVKEVEDQSKPLVIHCSAGVGRTGTYIAIDTLIDQLNAKENIDVSAVVSRMRENRTDMVQNVDQFMFIQRILTEHELFADFDRAPADIQAMNEDELQETESEEFNLLSEALVVDQKKCDILRVSTWSDKDQAAKKIDASFIQDFGCSTDFIASRQPTRDGVQQFWKVAVEQQVDVIVGLQENLQDGLARMMQNASVQLGSITIQATSRIDNEDMSHKILRVEVKGAIKMEREINYVLVKNWKSSEAPPSAGTVIKAIQIVEDLQQNKREKGRVLVCCSDGCQRTGAFIALVNILERLKAQNRVDVFRTVKDLRDMRPNMVGDMNSYMFIYSVILEYLSTFDTYANYK